MRSDTPTPPLAAMAAYGYLFLMLRLGVHTVPTFPLMQCTRCGGAHELSDCLWPRVRYNKQWNEKNGFSGPI